MSAPARLPADPNELSKDEARARTDAVRAKAGPILWAELLDLYRAGAHAALGFSSWEDYAWHEFEWKHSKAYALLDAGRVIEALEAHSAIAERPLTEGVSRKLAPVLKVGPEKVAEVWERAVETYGPSPIAIQVGRVVAGEVDSSLPGSLKQAFGWDPFSVLNSRDGEWRRRKNAWLGLGIRPEVGRKPGLTIGGFKQPGMPDAIRYSFGEGSTSAFDPALCELMYRWYAPAGGTVRDPFAGGSSRGVVAACLGCRYVGIELRHEQVESNRQQAREILRPTMKTPDGRPVVMPEWIEGDADEVLGRMDGVPEADFALTSPPFGDLEKYSDDPRDLSKMNPPNFERALRRILAGTVARLKDDAFAVIVMGDVRDKRSGDLRNLRGLTISAMADAGDRYYDHALLVTEAGTAPIRARAPVRGIEEARRNTPACARLHPRGCAPGDHED